MRIALAAALTGLLLIGCWQREDSRSYYASGSAGVAQ